MTDEYNALHRRCDRAELEVRWHKGVVAMLPPGVWQAAIDAFTVEVNREIAASLLLAASADPDNEYICMAAEAYNPQEPQP